MSSNQPRLDLGNLWVVSTAAASVALVLASTLDVTLNVWLLNILVATSVLVQGAVVIRIMWGRETRAGSVPLASCYFFTQHLAFGLGGFLVALFGHDYYYENANGVFAWEGALISGLRVHAASLNIGLLGVWIATSGRSQPIVSPSGTRWASWSWDKSRWVCFGALLLHLVVWAIIGRFGQGQVTYVAHAVAYHTDAVFLLWGLAWNRCQAKWVFVVYTAIYGLLEAIAGARGNFLLPVLLFGIGLLISSPRRILDFRKGIRWAPLALLVFLAINKSEDVRIEFARGQPANWSDALDRLESLGSESKSGRSGADALGQSQNGLFRVGGRLFELSAADIILNTPRTVPFWGWTDEDSSVLFTGFLPLKLNQAAAYYSSQTAGVLYLQSYGWVQVDPQNGNSMPATMIGDTWRRFGWVGIVAWFLAWSWFLATLTRILRSTPQQIFMTAFVAAMATNVVYYYELDMIYSISSLPRKLATIGVYAACLWMFNRMANLFVIEEERIPNLPSRTLPQLVPVATIQNGTS